MPPKVAFVNSPQPFQASARGGSEYIQPKNVPKPKIRSDMGEMILTKVPTIARLVPKMRAIQALISASVRGRPESCRAPLPPEKGVRVVSLSVS